MFGERRVWPGKVAADVAPVLGRTWLVMQRPGTSLWGTAHHRIETDTDPRHDRQATTSCGGRGVAVTVVDDPRCMVSRHTLNGS